MTAIHTTAPIFFPPKRGIRVLLPTLVVLTLILIPAIITLVAQGVAIEILILIWGFIYLLVAAISFAIQKVTSYYVLENTFHYRSFLMKGAIDIGRVKRLEIHVNDWSANNPATSNMKGVLISYNNFDQLFITPEDNKDFAAVLLNINPLIKVSSKKD